MEILTVVLLGAAVAIAGITLVAQIFGNVHNRQHNPGSVPLSQSWVMILINAAVLAVCIWLLLAVAYRVM